ncbi:MAG: ISNCY family transposase [Terriglobia bacterium]
MGRTRLSDRELVRSEIFGRVSSGSLSLKEACDLAKLSYRQGRRMWRRYRAEGAEGLQHRLCGRRSNRGYGAKFRAAVLQRAEERYGDFGPTLASEHLANDDRLEVSAETLRRWQRLAGQPGIRKRRAYRRRRERKAHFGELVQMDGSFHRWLEDRGGEGCMMHMVDDATSKALFRFSRQETTWAVADLLRRWIEKYGVPAALYTDWKNVYVRQPTEAERLRGVVPVSQFGKMCARLGIRIIAAGSPQAKGRVERAHGTHQDRLVKKLRLAGIASYEQANRYLEEGYVSEHNRRFSHGAASASDFHRKRPSRRKLDEIFQLEQERVVSEDWVVSYAGRLFQLERQTRRYAPAKSRVLVRENQRGELSMEYRGHKLGFVEIQKRPTRKIPLGTSGAPLGRHTVPAKDHPWRRSYKQMARGGTSGSGVVEKPLIGKVQKRTFPMSLEISQTTRDSHFPTTQAAAAD